MTNKSWEVIAKKREYGPRSYPETHLYHTQEEADSKANDLRVSGEYDTVYVVDRNAFTVRPKNDPTSAFMRDLWAVLEDHPIY